MVPSEAAAPAGSSPFAALAAAALAGIAVGAAALRARAHQRRLARHERRLANDRRELVQMARAHAHTQPSFAADLYAAATRHGED
jgi:hypothetical protein